MNNELKLSKYKLIIHYLFMNIDCTIQHDV